VKTSGSAINIFSAGCPKEVTYSIQFTNPAAFGQK